MTEIKWDVQLSVTESNNVGEIKPRQNNNNSELIRVKLTRNSEAYDLTALKVFFVTHFQNAESNGVNKLVQKEAKVIDAKKGIFEFIFDDDCMFKSGRQEAYFEVYDFDKFLDATQRFYYVVQPSSRKMLMDASSYIDTWENWEKKLEDNPAANLQKQIDNHELKKADIRDVDNKLSGKTDNKTFVDLTNDLQNQIDNTQSGLIGEFNSESDLKKKYPSGAKGYAIVYNNQIAYRYVWFNSNWENRGVFNGMGIPQKSVSRDKFNDVVSNELELYAENNINKNFELLNTNYMQLGVDISWYNRVLGCIQEIILIGFDSFKEHRLRFLARNNKEFNYRFIICSKNSSSSSWVDTFDSGPNFKVIENIKGITTLTHIIGDKTVILKINYSLLRDGETVNDGALGANDGRYKLKQECFFQNTLHNVKKDLEKITEMINTDNKKMIVKKSGSSIQVKYKYSDDTSEVVEFDELGINKIIHPKRFYKKKETSLTNDFSLGSPYFELETDWISPYQNVKALNGAINELDFTVGGNHGTQGASGFPTAKNVSTELYVDDTKIENNTDFQFGNTVTIVVKNIISAPNKIDPIFGYKADSILETVVYQIVENSIEVFVKVKALEDLEIGGYVGLQMTTGILSDSEAYFLDVAKKYKSDGVLHYSKALPFKNDRIVLLNDQDVVITHTKRDFGIGDLKYVGTSPIHFLSEYNKLYSHLVNQKVSLFKNESIEYSGSFNFMEKLECVGAEAAYFYIEGGERIYCVDYFYQNENSVLKLPNYFLGKKITILDKQNVDCEGYISSDGLKINSKGLGFIKFKINK